MLPSTITICEHDVEREVCGPVLCLTAADGTSLPLSLTAVKQSAPVVKGAPAVLETCGSTNRKARRE